jgi:hypothetical protein
MMYDTIPYVPNQAPNDPADESLVGSERSFRWLSDLVPRIAYKPGYRFSVVRLQGDLAKVSLECPALPNANKHSDTFGLTISDVFRLAKLQAPSDALQAFASVICRYELHEAAEFFYLDGATVFMAHRCGDSYGDFSWADFRGLGGKHLRLLCEQLRGREL